MYDDGTVLLKDDASVSMNEDSTPIVTDGTYDCDCCDITCTYGVLITFGCPQGTGTVDYSSTTGESGDVDVSGGCDDPPIPGHGQGVFAKHVNSVWTIDNNSDRYAAVQITNTNPPGGNNLCVNGHTLAPGNTYEFWRVAFGSDEDFPPGASKTITIICGDCP